MLERFDPDGRTLIAQAAEHARRLGHRYVGGEHLLLATVSAGGPAGAVMRISLLALEGELSLSVELPPERCTALALEVGDTVHVAPRRARVFLPEYSI